MTFFSAIFGTILAFFNISVGLAATPDRTISDEPEPSGFLTQAIPALPRPDFQRPAPQPQEPPKPILPPSEEILPQIPIAPNLPSQPTPSGDLPSSIVIKKFNVTGSTVFKPAEIDLITAQFANKPLDFTQVLQVANEITQLYQRNGYINSGAYIPSNQSFNASRSTIEIKIIEGRAEDIVVIGTKRLDPNYIKSRAGLGANKPLKIDRLIESLQLLQQDPLIKPIFRR